jgi:TusA-related sulfurtransferase
MFSSQRAIAVGGLLALVASGIAFAQTAPAQHPAPMDPRSAMHAGTVPTMPGQDAFGTVQEIVQILEIDPKTDWSKVNLEALRQHLIDMNEITLKAEAAPKEIDGGLEITVTGNDRTLVAIQQMIPAWVQTMNGHQGWSTKAAPLPNGEVLTVTATNPKEVQHIRGLGFIGLLVSGSHHQPHHLAMAKGEMAHLH